MMRSASGEGSEKANKRKVCIALTTGFRVRIGLGLESGRHLTKFPDAALSTMKTIARPENVRRRRNTSRSAPVIDQVMAEERAAAFAKRSIKTSAKLEGLKLAISMMDLTTLEGKDTPGKIAFLCRKAMQPLDPRYDVPSCAAVCVYPNMVRVAKKFLGSSGVKVASVATAFPTGLMPVRLKLQEV